MIGLVAEHSRTPIRRRHVPEPDADEQLAQLDPNAVDHEDARSQMSYRLELTNSDPPVMDFLIDASKSDP